MFAKPYVLYVSYTVLMSWYIVAIVITCIFISICCIFMFSSLFNCLHGLKNTRNTTIQKFSNQEHDDWLAGWLVKANWKQKRINKEKNVAKQTTMMTNKMAKMNWRHNNNRRNTAPAKYTNMKHTHPIYNIYNNSHITPTTIAIKINCNIHCNRCT